MITFKGILKSIIAVTCILTLWACSSFNPRPEEEVPFRDRGQTQKEGNVRVTAAVPSAKESKELFGVFLYNRGIQPIWLEIENLDEEPVWFLPFGVDSQYFTPLESAYLNHFAHAEPINREISRLFHQKSKETYIRPGSVRSGFVFTPVDEGTKEFNVDIMGIDNEIRTFTFFINVPGIRADHREVDFESLYRIEEIVFYEDEGEFREALENLPCCTTNKKGTKNGDPLNIVVVGEAEDVFYAFIRSGWDETETVYIASEWKTTLSFLFGGRYRYSPVSPLYVNGRSQDIALQRARTTIHERNHLRLYLLSMRFEGKPVWIGQISRDIGVRFTTKVWPPVTHKIDPDVDETRDFLIQDLWYSQVLVKFAFVKGVGSAPPWEPRGNLTGDPYYTDGNRVVLWVSSDPTEFDEVRNLEWETPYRSGESTENLKWKNKGGEER